MDPSINEFMKSHGGMAIGGVKYNLPGAPKAANGEVIVEGKPFKDK